MFAALRKPNSYSAESWSVAYDQDGLPVTKDLRLVVADLSDKITMLLEYLHLSTPRLHCDSSNDSGEIEVLADELLARSQALRQLAAQHYADGQDFVNREVARSNLRESRAVRRLANLASVFLPLTLAAGVLSTQHRLSDDPIFLWDLITLFLDVGVIVLVLLWIASSKHVKKMFDRYPHFRPTKPQVLFFGIPVTLCTLVAANIGSFRNIGIGWRVLVYGNIGVVVFMVVIPGAIFLLSFCFVCQFFGM